MGIWVISNNNNNNNKLINISSIFNIYYRVKPLLTYRNKGIVYLQVY